MSTLKENLLDQRKNSCSGTSNKKYSKNSKVIENLIKSEGEMMCSVLARERTFCKSLLCDFRKQFGRVNPPLWTLLQTQSKLKLGLECITPDQIKESESCFENIKGNWHAGVEHNVCAKI